MKRTLSLMLAALLLAGCAGPAAGTGEGEAVKANEASGTGGASSPRPALRTLAEPVYPEFPRLRPGGGPGGELRPEHGGRVLPERLCRQEHAFDPGRA